MNPSSACTINFQGDLKKVEDVYNALQSMAQAFERLFLKTTGRQLNLSSADDAIALCNLEYMHEAWRFLDRNESPNMFVDNVCHTMLIRNAARDQAVFPQIAADRLELLETIFPRIGYNPPYWEHQRCAAGLSRIEKDSALCAKVNFDLRGFTSYLHNLRQTLRKVWPASASPETEMRRWWAGGLNNAVVAMTCIDPSEEAPPSVRSIRETHERLASAHSSSSYEALAVPSQRPLEI